METTDLLSLSREDLEKLALERVCSYQYYDLADTVDETSDEELFKVIHHVCQGDESCDLTD